MKILYLAPPRNQPEMLSQFTFVDEEIRALAARGHDVYLITYPGTKESPDSPERRIHLSPLPSRKIRRDFFRISAFIWQVKKFIPAAFWFRPFVLFHTARLEQFSADLIRDNGIDVIHSNFAWPNGFGGVLTKHISATPLVASLRGMDVLLDRKLDYGLRRDAAYDAALRILLRDADLTVHVSHFIRECAIRLGANPTDAKTVLKGVDCQTFNDTHSSQGKNTSVQPTILTVAGLIKRKGISTILQALGQLVGCHDFSLVVVGEGPELNDLKAQCDSLSLTQNTTFVGFVPRTRMPSFFAACDIFVLGSLLEASGNVLLEAMASGRPVVCTNSGGPAEYVVESETGFVVPPGDPKIMAARIKELLDDGELRIRMGRQARNRAAERFPYTRMVSEIETVYAAAIDRKKGW